MEKDSNKRQNIVNEEVVESKKTKKQTNISNFFGGNSKARVSPSTSMTQKKASGSRTLQVTTAEKWIQTSLAKYSAQDWLLINPDSADKKLVASMNCNICRKFEDRITSVKGFSDTWLKEGSRRVQLSAAIEHVEGEAHKKAFEMHLRSKGLSAHERTHILKPSQNEGVIQGIDRMQQKDLEFTKKKFETAYFVVKEELPLSKFHKILELEEMHGVELGNAYRNEITGGVLIDYIASSLSKELKLWLDKTEFYSVLTDGSTDVSIVEKEAIFVLTFDPMPVGTNKVEIKLTYLNLADIKNANPSGVLASIRESFKEIGIDDFMKKLVGFGADGASVNSGNKGGVKTLLQNENKWITFGWCIAHRLELALKDSLSGTSFDEVDELILRMHYLYKRSPKKLRQLKELVNIYEDTFDFQVGSYKPKKASGTRWISHKLAALEVIIDKYGILMQHLKSLAEDKSYPSADRAKFKGWYNKWTQTRIPLLACLAIEVLAPAKILSKTFQLEEVDIVLTAAAIKQAKDQMARIERKACTDLPTVKKFLQNIDDSNSTYQDVKLKAFEQGLQTVEHSKTEWTIRVKNSMENRLETLNESRHASNVDLLNTEGWHRGDTDGDFLDDAIAELFIIYQLPMANAGFKGSVAELLEQWHEIRSFAIQYLSPQSQHYHVVWRKLFESTKSSDWSGILLLAKILFTLPVSNAKVERLFSLMNRVKTDSRNSLSKERLNSLLRICMEGPPLAQFDAIPAMQLWQEGVRLRRPNQSSRKAYKARVQKARPSTLIDIEESQSDTEEDNN